MKEPKNSGRRIEEKRHGIESSTRRRKMMRQNNMMHRTTTLGLDERLERVLAYVFIWVSGLILFFIEKNRNVRWHAAQSLVTFGTVSLVLFVLSLLTGLTGGILSNILVIGILFKLVSVALGFIYDMVWWAGALLWVWLMIMAFLRTDYRLPFFSKWADRLA
jgi:uncharacterized membrane protein